MGVRTVVIERKSEMKAKVSWVEGMKFVGESESGHQVTLDGANLGEGASPMEMILLAVGGCSSIDVVSIVEKARQSVTACHVELEVQGVVSVAYFWRLLEVMMGSCDRTLPAAGMVMACFCRVK